MTNKVLAYLALVFLLTGTAIGFFGHFGLQVALLGLALLCMWFRENYISNTMQEIGEDVQFLGGGNGLLKSMKELVDTIQQKSDEKLGKEKFHWMLRHNPRDEKVIAKDPVLKVKRSTRLKLSKLAGDRKRKGGRFV